MDTRSDDVLPSLPTAQYKLLVAPALQIATKVAATRGDPLLCNDLPTMLALSVVVRALGECYLHEHADTDSSVRAAIEGAPAAISAMVLEHAEMEPDAVGACLRALRAAGDQLVDADILDAGREQKAAWEIWQQLTAGDRDAAIRKILVMTVRIVESIDAWERRRAG
ncbi:MAG TPA: hypothetical protein VFQ88_05335 [Nevskiaceae bacterium]|nr:hypothetical protein [Nevskiaceae bacterium]